jgi:hypothetical protein
MFLLKDLPGGEYLIGAVTDLEPEDLGDLQFLEALAAQSLAVAVVDGERTVQNLQIAR